MNSSDKEIKNYTLIRTPELLIGKRRNLPSIVSLFNKKGLVFE